MSDPHDLEHRALGLLERSSALDEEVLEARPYRAFVFTGLTRLRRRRFARGSHSRSPNRRTSSIKFYTEDEIKAGPRWARLPVCEVGGDEREAQD